MGLTKLTTDEVIRDDETHLQKKGSTSAYATDKDIWTIQCHQLTPWTVTKLTVQTVGGTLKLLYKAGGVT